MLLMTVREILVVSGDYLYQFCLSQTCTQGYVICPISTCSAPNCQLHENTASLDPPQYGETYKPSPMRLNAVRPHFLQDSTCTNG